MYEQYEQLLERKDIQWWRTSGEWKAYNTANGETMVINDQSELKDDPDREARKLI